MFLAQPAGQIKNHGIGRLPGPLVRAGISAALESLRAFAIQSSVLRKTRPKGALAPPRASKGMGARVRRPARTSASKPPSTENPRRWRETGWAVLLFFIASVVLSYPLALHPASYSRLDNGDARLNAWAISWVAHQLTQDPLRLFEANTFYPLPHTLAYSEHLTALGVMAMPILAVTDDLVLTGNLLLLFAMFLSAMGMYWLAHSITRNHKASILAGLFFSFATFRFNRLPHIQMQFYAFLPLFLAAWHRYLESRRRWDLFQVGIFFVLQALAGTYLGAIAAVALAVALVTLGPFARLGRREAAEVFLVLLLSTAVLWPFAAPYLWVHRELGVEWDLAGVGSLSATPSSYLASTAHLYRSLSEYLWRENAPTDYLFPGVTLLALGTLGAILLLRGRENTTRSPAISGRALFLCYGAILALGFLISLGPRTPLHPFLYEHLVFFRGLRALTRFALLPLLALSVFSAVALAWLFDERVGLRRPKTVAWAVALFFAAESTALPYHLERWVDSSPEVYPWLAGAKPGPIVELPFKVIDTQYMFWARHHGFRPMLNGDSGFIPISHQWMKTVLGRFPSNDSIALLRRLGVRYVVLHLGAFRKARLLRTLRGLQEQRSALVPARDFGRDLVFEVAPDTAIAPASSSGLTALKVEASDVDGAFVDGDTGEPVVREAENGTVEVHLVVSGPASLEALRLHYGAVPRVPAESVSVAIERETETVFSPYASTPADWPAVTELVLGLLATPRDGTQTVALPPLAVQSRARLAIRIRGLDGEAPLLTEIEALGSITVAPRTDALGPQ